MTWSDFNTKVREHLTVHNRRQNIQTLINQLIRAAAHDLQSAVPALCTGHTSVYGADRVTADGYAAKGRFSPGITITRAYVRDATDHTKSRDLTPVFGQASEQAMVSGAVAADATLIAIRSNRGEFRAVPVPVAGETEIVLVWDGSRVDFCDDDDLPNSWAATPTLALVVAEFVLARLSRQVDQDLALAESFGGSYSGGKRRIKSDWNEATNVPARNDQA